MFKYIQELTENSVKEKNTFTCHYQMFENSECVYKFVDSVIKRKDIISLLEKEDKNLININLSKKNKKSNLNLETSKVETNYYYENYKNMKERIYVCGQDIEEKLKNKLKEFNVSIKLETKETINKNIDNEKINFVKLISLDINKFTLKEVEEILNIINNRLINLTFIV